MKEWVWVEQDLRDEVAARILASMVPGMIQSGDRFVLMHENIKAAFDLADEYMKERAKRSEK